jgi:hypothetical protein
MFQIEAPAKFGQRVFGKEFGGTSVPREIPRGGLRAVLSKLGGIGLCRFALGAAHAHEAAGLVLS